MINKWLLLCGIILGVTGYSSNAQTSEELQFYQDPFDEQEVSPSKARYKKRISLNRDGSMTSEWIFIPNNTIVHSESYKNGAPVGIWSTANKNGKSTSELDYRFELNYTKEACRSGLRYHLGRDTLEEAATGKFRAPKLIGYRDHLELLGKKLRYPAPSRENGIQGRVVLTMTLSKEGILKDVMVLKSADSILDKEAARVVYLGREWEPATVNGQPVELCITLPVTFKLD